MVRGEDKTQLARHHTPLQQACNNCSMADHGCERGTLEHGLIGELLHDAYVWQMVHLAQSSNDC